MTAEKPGTQRGQLWLLAREGQAGRDLVARVAVRTRTWKLYSYGVPAELTGQVRPGVLVRVPYGRSGRPREGWCVRLTRETWDHTLRPIEAVIAGETILSGQLLELGLWVSEYYACPPAQTLDALVPAVLRRVRLRKVSYVRATGRSAEGRLSRQQQALLAAVADGPVRRAEALRAAGVGPGTLTTLRRRGLVELLSCQEPAPVALEPPVDEPAPQAPSSEEDSYTLTEGQQAALDAIAASAEPPRFQVFLLFGVPGSGKTEVYVRAARAVIAAGRQVIILVPEIALATQVVQRLTRRFARVAVLHSRLTPGVRARTLRAIAGGRVDVIIGTRTAVFAPCPRPGLIIVDEEQETSFKNLQAPFFHARDVAIKRGQLEAVPVVLGTATPALETWYNARTLKHFTCLELPERVPGAQLPRVQVVETAGRAFTDSGRLLSPELVRQLRDTLAAGRQALLLHNRRGYAVYLRCVRCGLTVACTRCGAHLVYHRAEKRAKCHRCGAWRPVPTRCLDDTCGARLQSFGLGVQRLEQELEQHFPGLRLQRLDSDTMRRREDYAAALERFAAGEARILLGTQMVAKGLDFPQVGLVGVVEADAGLWLPDFRAAEQTFQLLVQVVGRAGRQAGESLALIQVGNATLPAIRAAVGLDYPAFAAHELGIRRRFCDPPFYRLIRLVCADPSPDRARSEAGVLADRLRRLAGRVHAGIRIDEAEPCVVSRLRELFRYQVLARIPREADPRRLLRVAQDEKVFRLRVRRFTIDVDPLDMM